MEPTHPPTPARARPHPTPARAVTRRRPRPAAAPSAGPGWPGRAASLALLAALAAPAGGQAPARELGWLEFENSGAAAAQPAFLEGVLLLHSFEFDDAAVAFREAQRVDPDFALAWWGEAMTYNHPLWQEQDRERALAALARYAPDPARRQARAPTPREAAYLEAVDILYGPGTKAERDRRYMQAMRRLHEAWPDDLEARTFYALAILGSTDGVRDFATYMRAAAVAQPAFDANPRHPGAVHYLIHSFDDPVHAPLGLPAARAYAGIAPDAGHAQHMTSHIFVALGMWDDVVDANVRARDVQNAGRARAGDRPNVCGHYTSWLHYGWLMQGRPQAAEEGMEACHRRMAEGPSASEQGYFADMRARHVLDLQDWAAAARWDAELTGPALRDRIFVDGYAAARRGDRGAAMAALDRLRSGGSGTPAPRDRIQELELAALLRLDAGDGDGAVALLREAADLEETLPFEFGPPASLKPPHELLGQTLLELGRADEAVDAFEAALRLTPERTPSLAGLAAAARRSGRSTVAADAEARLERAWARAEDGFRERFVSGG